MIRLLKRVLIPLWILQLSLLVFIMAATSFLVFVVSVKSPLKGPLFR